MVLLDVMGEGDELHKVSMKNVRVREILLEKPPRN